MPLPCVSPIFHIAGAAGGHLHLALLETLAQAVVGAAKLLWHLTRWQEADLAVRVRQAVMEPPRQLHRTPPSSPHFVSNQ